MKACRYFMVIGLVVALSECSFSQEIWTIGPMLHVNFGGEKKTTSFAIETAYWNVYKFPYSVDFAIEFDRGRIRLYSEAQTGIGVTGISLGPVVEFKAKGPTRLGVQGSCWANYILGVDYRVRFIDKKRFHGFGGYLKLPIATAGLDESSSSSSHHSYHHWDWD